MKIFTMGGAASHDKEQRRTEKTWWSQELPSAQEYQEAIENLTLHNWSVDYIFTHCAPGSVQNQIADSYQENELTGFLDDIRARTLFNKWFFGHYHRELCIDKEFVCVFDKIFLLE